MTTTVTLNAGPVIDYEFGSFPAVIAGDPPQWSDASDATYATSEVLVGGSGSSPYAAFESLPGITQLLGLRITVRYSTEYPDGTLPGGVDPRSLSYELWPDHTVDSVRTWSQSTDTPDHPGLGDDDSIHEFTYSLFPAPWMSSGDEATWEPVFRGVIQTGVLINFYAGSGGLAGERHAFATIYEVTLEVDYVGADMFVFVGNLDDANPVTRLFPRDDTLGVGGPNRIIPAPRGNRIIGRQP